MSRPTRLTVWSQELGFRKRHSALAIQQEEYGQQQGVKNLNDLRQMLTARFGSTVAAWRDTMDPEGSGRLSYVQFIMAIDDIGGYTGSVKQLWAEISQGLTHVTLQELDPVSYKLLEAFQKSVAGRFATLRGFWKALDADGVERLDEATFTAQCVSLGIDLSPKQLSRIWKLLLPANLEGRHLVNEHDLKALLLTLPKVERAAVWGAASQVSPVEVADTGENSQAANVSRPSTPANGLPCMSPQDFRRLLKRQCGSLYAGWVKWLDIAEAGRVPVGEFGNRVRDIGVAGNVRALFDAIDEQQKGFLTLEDLDPNLAKAVSSFVSLLQDKYGSVSAAWQKAFNVNSQMKEEQKKKTQRGSSLQSIHRGQWERCRGNRRIHARMCSHWLRR